MAHLCASELGLKDIARKRKSTMAKDFGLKGRGRYLDSFDTSALTGYGALNSLLKEAVLVAWSDLKN